MSEIKKGINELKVNELRIELEKRGLEKTGIKIALVERLEKAIKAEGYDVHTYKFEVLEANKASAQDEDESETQCENLEYMETMNDVEDRIGNERENDSHPVDHKETATMEQEEKQTALNQNDELSTKNADGEGNNVVGTDDSVVSDTEKKSTNTKLDKEVKDEVIEIIEVKSAESKKEHQKSSETSTIFTQSSKRQQQNDIVILGHSSHSSIQQPKQRRPNTFGTSDLASSLWIKNITNTTKAADLKALFSKHGKVITAKIFTTKNKQCPTCFGYVTLSDPEIADLCVQKLNRQNFKGRIINVEKADSSNLSQFNKNVSAQAKQHSEKAFDDSAKNSFSSAPAKDSKYSKAEETASSDSRKSTRPRIVAVKDSSAKDPYSVKKRITGSTSSYNNRHQYAGARSRSFAYRDGTSYPLKNREPYSMIRRVTHTRSGIRVSMPYRMRQQYPAEFPGNQTMAHRSMPIVNRDTRSRSPAENEKEEMLRMMRRREDEHRKREEELRLEKEREKLKYEREKLEREKLELETIKLQAQLAQAAQLQMAAGLPGTAALAPATALIGSTTTHQHPQFLSQIRHSENETARPGSAKDSKKSSQSEQRSQRGREMTSHSRSYRSRSRHASRTIEEPSGIDRFRRSRSRSPIRRSLFGGKYVESTTHRESEHRALKKDRGYNEDLRRKPAGRNTYTSYTSDAYNSKTPQQYSEFRKQNYYGESNNSGRGFNDQSVQSMPSKTQGRRPVTFHGRSNRDFFGSTRERYETHNSSDSSYMARTDPSYVSRMGGQMQQSSTTAGRSADEMFGTVGFNMTSTHADFGQTNERQTTSGAFSQSSPWGGTASGSGNWGGSSAGAGWNMYGAGSSTSNSEAVNRFQSYKPSYTGERRY